MRQAQRPIEGRIVSQLRCFSYLVNARASSLVRPSPLTIAAESNSLFAGLPELIGVLCTRSAEAMVRHHEAVPVTDDPISEFLPLALTFRSGAREQADLCERLYAPTNVDGGLTEEYPPHVQRTLSRVKDTISRTITAGQLRPVDDQELFQQLWAIVHGLTSLELRGVLGTSDECDRIWHDTITTYVRGLAAAS